MTTFEETNVIVNIRKKLNAMRMPWSMPTPTEALRKKIAEHEREVILAEEQRQHAVAIVDYHTRTTAALRQHLRKLEELEQRD